MVDKQNENNGNTDDAVGYGRPPRKHQFKKGQSGNPKGRPKGSRNFKTIVCETLKSPVQVLSNGKRRKISMIDAAMLRLKDKAIRGEQRSIDRVIGLGETYLVEEAPEELAANSSDDDAVMRLIEARFRSGAIRSFSKPQPDTDDEEDDDSWLN